MECRRTSENVQKEILRNIKVKIHQVISRGVDVMNLYGTWGLSWTCLDFSQDDQVSHKYQKVGKHFAND